MNTNELNVLKIKLKRQAISFNGDENNFEFGGYYPSTINIFLLAILPFILSFVLIIAIISEYSMLSNRFINIIFASSIALIFGGLFNQGQLKKKRRLNHSQKILKNNTLIIDNKVYNQNNCYSISVIHKTLDSKFYEGFIFLEPKEGSKIVILTLNDENEQFLKSDLKWFQQFFAKEINL